MTPQTAEAIESTSDYEPGFSAPTNAETEWLSRNEPSAVAAVEDPEPVWKFKTLEDVEPDADVERARLVLEELAALKATKHDLEEKLEAERRKTEFLVGEISKAQKWLLGDQQQTDTYRLLYRARHTLEHWKN